MGDLSCLLFVLPILLYDLIGGRYDSFGKNDSFNIGFASHYDFYNDNYIDDGYIMNFIKDRGVSHS